MGRIVVATLVGALGLVGGCSLAGEPMVDRMGVSDAKYNRDLAACKQQTVVPVGFSNPVATCMTGKGYHVLMGK